MANKKKNSEAAPTPEQQARAASSSRKKQRKTYVSKTVKIVLVVIGVLAMLLSVSAMACSGLMSQTENTSSGYKLTGGVAATINGTNLTEDTVTKQIMSMRTSYGYTKDKDWAQYLVDNDLTPKKYRKQLIDSYTQQIIPRTPTRIRSRRAWRSRNSRMPSRPRASPRTARSSITSTRTCPNTMTPVARRTF